ncbi:MAG: hypothetical protein JWM53_3440, partial [bacterium]|nr:hypothetical protein [bacterium]
ALHATSGGANQQAFVYKQLATRPNPMYTRSFIYVPSATAGAYSFELLDFSTASSSSYSQVAYDPQQHAFLFHGNFVSPVTMPALIPLDRWFCLETMMHFDPTAGEVKVSLDGVTIGDIKNTQTEPAGVTLDNFSAALSGAVNTADVYFDEIAVSASPIGCN